MRTRSFPTVAALEVPHRFGAINAQRAEVERLISDSPGVDLVLLSECAITGYVSPVGDFDLRRFAEPIDGATGAQFAELARRYDVAIAGPIIEQVSSDTFNAHVVWDRGGNRIAHYRKRHPWIPETWASPGDLRPPLFELGGAIFTLAICFDLHFLANDAASELAAADVLLFPSAWTEEGADSRDELLPALAQEFEIAVVNANWGVGAPLVEGQGASRIIDRRGRELVRADGVRRIISAALE